MVLVGNIHFLGICSPSLLVSSGLTLSQVYPNHILPSIFTCLLQAIDSNPILLRDNWTYLSMEDDQRTRLSRATVLRGRDFIPFSKTDVDIFVASSQDDLKNQPAIALPSYDKQPPLGFPQHLKQCLSVDRLIDQCSWSFLLSKDIQIWKARPLPSSSIYCSHRGFIYFDLSIHLPILLLSSSHP